LTFDDIDELVLRAVGVAKSGCGARCKSCEIDAEIGQTKQVTEWMLYSAVHTRGKWLGVDRLLDPSGRIGRKYGDWKLVCWHDG
jgi:hypothetical protein